MDVLGKRLDRFGLTLHPDKTNFIDFRPQRHGATPPDCKVQSFDFLGFTLLPWTFPELFPLAGRVAHRTEKPNAR
jgi:hypothetical protein